MPTLNWIGKDEIVQHDKEVKFKLFRKLKGCSVGDKSKNLLIHGDNLEALKALMPYYQGQIKCIYIDPPYNTGNENWVYNDNVNSPKIKKWLNKSVNREDLTRHDKWLCMMYPRLKLLKELLRDDGVIFISIDDNEHCNLKHLMDEIFGLENFVASYIWESRSGKGATAKHVVNQHEYIVCYSKDISKLALKEDIRESKGGNYEDERGRYKREQLRQWGQGDKREDRPTMFYDVKGEKGDNILPIREDGSEGRWRISETKMKELIEKGDVDFVFDGTRWQLYRKIREGRITKTAIGTFLFGLGTASTGTIQLKELFSDKVFDTTKPINLIKYLISLAKVGESDIVLDSFTGSGTTGHAVMDLNKEDNGNRRFILIEMEDNVCKPITSERLKKAIEKYNYKDGFEYCELGKPLFNEEGDIEEECSFEQLATYIYFTETQTNIDKKEIKGNFIGEFKPKKSEYYLIFKEKYTNVLKRDFIEKIKKNNNKKVIYADQCLIDKDTLEKNNIQFKQIPYEVKKY